MLGCDRRADFIQEVVHRLAGAVRQPVAVGRWPLKRAITLIRRISDALAASVGGWLTSVPMTVIPRLPELEPLAWKAVTSLIRTRRCLPEALGQVQPARGSRALTHKTQGLCGADRRLATEQPWLWSRR